MIRAFERLLAVVTLLLLLPSILLVAALVRLSSPGPVLIGREVRRTTGDPVTVLEFRVKSDDGQETRLGSVLRRYHLHLMPSLVSVARGDVGLRDTGLWTVSAERPPDRRPPG